MFIGQRGQLYAVGEAAIDVTDDHLGFESVKVLEALLRTV